MSLIQWVGFVERYVLEEDIYLQILNQQERSAPRQTSYDCTHAGKKEVKGA